MTVANPDPGTTNEPVAPTAEPTTEPVSSPEPSASPEPNGALATDGNAPDVPHSFPDDWRKLMAGDPSEYESEDLYEKEMKRLERFKSPNDVFKSYREVEKLAKSRKPDVPRPGKDASPDDVERYRAEKGLPNSPQDYNLDFDDGFTVGEDLKDDVDAILDLAHSNYLDNDTTKQLVRAFADNKAGEMQVREKVNDEARIDTLSTLKSEWGGEFDANLNAIPAVFANQPKELMAQVLNMVDPETGVKLGNTPEGVKWLVDLGKTLNPTATLVPSGKNDAAGISDEINKIESMMWSQDKAERQKYRSDPGMQKRYRELLMHRQKMQG